MESSPRRSMDANCLVREASNNWLRRFRPDHLALIVTAVGVECHEGLAYLVARLSPAQYEGAQAGIRYQVRNQLLDAEVLCEDTTHYSHALWHQLCKLIHQGLACQGADGN